MKTSTLQPSPALCVPAHTPIGECVRLMKSRDVGSLLIMNQSRPEELAGIFTERDLLKWIDEIQHGGHWDKPVAHLMSRPVVTLPIERFEEAPQLMLERRIRHLPITSRGSLLGVVSMRDLLARELQLTRDKNAEKLTRRARKKHVVFLCDGSPEHKAESRTLAKWSKVFWETRPVPANLEELSETADELETSDLAIVDLDGIAPGHWTPLLREINRRKDSPPLILMLTERSHPQAAVKALRTLSSSGKWPVFAKPISMMGFLASLRKHLED